MTDSVGNRQSDTCRRERWTWLVILLALCLWAAWRMGAFDLSTVVTFEGRQISVPNVFATVDHPLHATRAHTLLEALQRGEILRWVGDHQGGYPAEFYPLGIAWLDVALWALLMGSLPIIAVHKLAVIIVFLLPAVAFWVLARGDGVHPSVPVLATAAHLAIPGHWLNGGYTELVGWGLITNVAGASLALIAGGALARFVLHEERGFGVLAILAAAAGACTNPRSLFAVVIAALAILLTAGVTGDRAGIRGRILTASMRVGLVGSLAVLMAAPVILALFRYQQHYFFLHYEFYDPISRFWEATGTAVTPVIALLAIGGAILPWITARLTVTRAMSLTLAGYVLFTIWVATSSWTPPLVEQLEAPRLMPFQRQLMIYLGAVVVTYAIQLGSARLALRRSDVTTGVVVGVVALTTLILFVRPLGFVPERYRGTPADGAVPETFQSLSSVSTTGSADFAAFREAVATGEMLRVDGTSMFVIGNRDDWWHEQLWAPTVSNAPFYYDDWLWYWTTSHQGPYDYRNGHYFPNPSLALTSDYIANNGISVVLVTDMWVPSGEAPRDAARANSLLEHERTIGAWDIYRVRNPVSLVTNGDAMPVTIEIGNERIAARFERGDGHVLIRRNWFPRWQATVNGEHVAIVPRDDGYMEIQVPPGPIDLEVTYRVTALDWIGRGASVAGTLGTVVLAVYGSRLFGASGMFVWVSAKKPDASRRAA